MSKFLSIIVILLLALSCVFSLFAYHRASQLDKQHERLVADIARIDQNLQHINSGRLQHARSLASPRMSTAMVSIEDRPTLGDKNARLAMVGFIDYQCAYCRRFYQDTYSKLKADYIDSGKMKFVVKDLPLAMHSYSWQAARAVHCAEDQGKFWAMYDGLFSESSPLNDKVVRNISDVIRLDGALFEQCLANADMDTQIESDLREANEQGISGTPTFVLGLAGDEQLQGIVIRGAVDYSILKARIDALLR